MMELETRLFRGDCLKQMDVLIAEGVEVDAIITDPPFGTTQCKWDSVIDLNAMWLRLNKLIKVKGAIVLFGSQPFTSALIMSNVKMFKYCWVWRKSLKVGFQNANRRPLKNHEDLIIFGGSVYNPQGLQPYGKTNKRGSVGEFSSVVNTQKYTQKYTNYPCSVLEIASQGKTRHPTQKPVPLMEYLIKTYTNEGETVLDFTMGSGTTGVACVNLDRSFIGIELDEKYFNIAAERIDLAIKELE